MRKALKQEATEIEEEPPSQGTAGSSIRERPPVAEVRIENVEVKEWRKGKRKRPTEGGKAKDYVYILTDVGGKGHSYVGYSRTHPTSRSGSTSTNSRHRRGCNSQ